MLGVAYPEIRHNSPNSDLFLIYCRQEILLVVGVVLDFNSPIKTNLWVEKPRKSIYQPRLRALIYRVFFILQLFQLLI